MPTLDRDKYRKVSSASNVDFVRGYAKEATKYNKVGVLSFTLTALLHKALRRLK